MANDVDNKKDAMAGMYAVLPYLAVMAGLGGLGFVTYKIIGAITGTPDVVKYMRDVHEETVELVDYQREISALDRPPTEEESQTLDIVQHQLKVKEVNCPDTWLPDLVDTIQDVAKGNGLYIVIPMVAGVMAATLLYFYRKRNPPGGPRYICRSCNAEFTSMKDLNAHMRSEHRITNDPDQLALAQSYFEELPLFTQSFASIAASEYGVPYDVMYEDWATVPRKYLEAFVDSLNETAAYTATTMAAMTLIQQTLWAMVLI